MSKKKAQIEHEPSHLSLSYLFMWLHRGSFYLLFTSHQKFRGILNMKTITTTFFILILCFSVSAQNKMTDREFEGFKGSVKSVSIETMPLSDSRLKNKRVVWEKWSFDQDGRKSEEYNPQAKSKVIFTVIDGHKTSKSIAEKGENSESLNFRFVYEYDSQGRVKTEKRYLNNGKLTSQKTLKYRDDGQVKEEIADDPASTIKVSYKYDEKGNLIEKLEEQKGKGEFGTDSKSKSVYGEYKVDVQGNWTQRKSTLYYEGDGAKTEYVSMDYRVFTYYKAVSSER